MVGIAVNPKSLSGIKITVVFIWICLGSMMNPTLATLLLGMIIYYTYDFIYFIFLYTRELRGATF